MTDRRSSDGRSAEPVAVPIHGLVLVAEENETGQDVEVEIGEQAAPLDFPIPVTLQLVEVEGAVLPEPHLADAEALVDGELVDAATWPGTGRLVRLPIHGMTVAEQPGRPRTTPFLDRVVA